MVFLVEVDEVEVLVEAKLVEDFGVQGVLAVFLEVATDALEIV